MSIKRYMAMAGCFNIVLIVAYLLAYPGAGFPDPSVLIHAGDLKCDEGFDCQGIYKFPDSWGYDGFFYWVIASNPTDFDEISHITKPAYRYQRIGYPLLAYALSFGQRQLLPFVLPIINLAFIILSVRSFGMLMGKERWSSMYPGLIVGITVSTVLDVAEPMWMYLILEAFRQHIKNEHKMSALLFTASVLTKETTLLLLGPLMLFMVFKQRKDIGWYCLPIAVFVAWQLAMYAAFQEFAILASANSGYLFQGVFESIEKTLAKPSIHRIPVHVLQLTMVVSVILAIHSGRKGITKYNFLLFICAFLTFMMKDRLISDIFSAARNVLPAALCLMLYYVDTRDWKAHIALVPQAALSLLLLFFYIAKTANELG